MISNLIIDTIDIPFCEAVYLCFVVNPYHRREKRFHDNGVIPLVDNWLGPRTFIYLSQC